MTQQTVELDMTKAEEFVGRLFDAGSATADVFTVYIGDRLGLYRVLANRGPLTAAELAEVAAIHPRYAREWCEQQAVTGILAVDNEMADPDVRSFSLPAEHAAALVDPDSPFSIAPLARAI